MNVHRSWIPLLTTMLMGSAFASAQSSSAHRFSESDLNGCYGAREQGDGAVAAGLGVVCYDGAGNTKRSLTVNAPNGEGGRRILKFESEGSYTVEADGTGTAVYVNQISNGQMTSDTFDLMITGAATVWIPGRGFKPVATEIFGAQREAGITVSLVTSLQKRISGYR